MHHDYDIALAMILATQSEDLKLEGWALNNLQATERGLEGGRG